MLDLVRDKNVYGTRPAQSRARIGLRPRLRTLLLSVRDDQAATQAGLSRSRSAITFAARAIASGLG